MSKYQLGESGNPKGRPRGAIGRRTQMSKLLESHGEELIKKVIELALEGDQNALRLCVERLIPKVRNEPIAITLPNELNQDNVLSIKDMVLRATVDGKISIPDAQKLIDMIGEQSSHTRSKKFPAIPIDPIEAVRVYKEIMMRT